MPASSPGIRSMISALKPRRSHQRRYMRSSISAQSCDSVPPAPAWIATMALRSSYGPENVSSNSRSSSCDSSAAVSRSMSAAVASSSSASASSTRSSRSATCFSRPRHVSTRARIGDEALHHVLRGLLVVPEAGGGGLLLERGCLGFELGMSKTRHDMRDALAERGEAVSKFLHVRRSILSTKSAGLSYRTGGVTRSSLAVVSSCGCCRSRRSLW